MCTVYKTDPKTVSKIFFPLESPWTVNVSAWNSNYCITIGDGFVYLVGGRGGSVVPLVVDRWNFAAQENGSSLDTLARSSRIGPDVHARTMAGRGENPAGPRRR
jgi:hypothetical protein